MSTIQATRPATKNTSWGQIFPNEQVTEQRSKLFVKKLIAVAISNITYLRNIFPETAFGDKCLEDLNLKILRDESSCPGACQVIKWVKGCFDALDKKYLKTLIVGIYVDPNDPETVIESYTFRFSYQNDGAVDIYRNDKKISCAYTAEETKKATIKLLRTLIVLTNTLSPLPDNVMMTMKLLYFDEATPADYEPPGFKPSNDNIFGFQEEATNVSVGSVSTSFHTVKLRIKSSSTQFDVHEETLGDCQDETMDTDQLITDPLQKDTSEKNNKKEKQAEEKEIDTKEKKDSSLDLNEKQSEKDDSESANTEANEDEFKVRCPCGCNEDDGLMIMCGNCKFWQHGVCFLVTNEDKAPENHTCDICTKLGDPDLRPTDPQLCEMSSITVQATCLWRRALTVCTEFKRIVAPDFAHRLGVENTVAQGLINRLEKEGFITKTGKGKKLGKVVNKGKIESDGFPKYLGTPKILNSDNVLDAGDFTTESPVKQTNLSVEKEIMALTTGAKKLTLDGRKANASPVKVNSTTKATQEENKVSSSRKRVRSKSQDIEFDLASSQDNPAGGTRKKASKVSKDLAL